MGAAGLTCSTCEMGGRGNVGLEIELDKVPQRETGMNAYEIMLSESQERMLLVADKGREQEVLDIFAKWGLDAVEIGHVIGVTENVAKMRVFHHGELVAEIPNAALTDDAPVYQRPLERMDAVPKFPRDIPANVDLSAARDPGADLKSMLAAPNICSKRRIHQQYDSMVQTNTVEGPGLEAGVVRIKGTNRALAMALDGNGRWCYLDPKLGAMHAVAEAARNVACTGARPVAATNCLNFGSPEKPGTMWQFSQVVDGITRACEELETPITGGNVSFYNETLGEGIWPTPVIGVVGILDDVHRATQSHFREAGRAILLLRASEPGDATDVEQEFGSSEYAKEVLGTIWGFPPALEIEREHALQRAIVKLIRDGLIESAHDCSDGGLAVTLAESSFGTGIGADIGAAVNLTSNGLPLAAVLFGEDASRIVISCDEKNTKTIQNTALEYGVAADLLGHTATEQFSITVDGQPVVTAKVSELKAIWESALDRALHAGTEEHLVPDVLQKS